MTKAVLNRDICCITAVLSFCKHGHFSLNFALHGVNCQPYPPPPILLGLRKKYQDIFIYGRTHGQIERLIETNALFNNMGGSNTKLV